MLKEFMLIFALMLFIMATYYVIKFAHGEVPTRTGVVAIISLIGSVCYPIYYFSGYNPDNKVQQTIDAVLPIPEVLDNAFDLIQRGRTLHRDVRDTASEVTDSALGGVANATFAYGTTALISTASLSYIPGLAAVLAGPFGWLVIPLFAFLLGATRDTSRRFRVYGGKRAKKTA